MPSPRKDGLITEKSHPFMAHVEKNLQEKLDKLSSCYRNQLQNNSRVIERSQKAWTTLHDKNALSFARQCQRRQNQGRISSIPNNNTSEFYYKRSRLPSNNITIRNPLLNPKYTLLKSSHVNKMAKQPMTCYKHKSASNNQRTRDRNSLSIGPSSPSKITNSTLSPRKMSMQDIMSKNPTKAEFIAVVISSISKKSQDSGKSNPYDMSVKLPKPAKQSFTVTDGWSSKKEKKLFDSVVSLAERDSSI